MVLEVAVMVLHHYQIHAGGSHVFCMSENSVKAVLTTVLNSVWQQLYQQLAGSVPGVTAV
jgi:hypothetical protein